MAGKGVKCPSGWTLLDENIENVERVSLDVASQRDLGCLVGEVVFLEYPWAYVARDAVWRLSRAAGSPLEPHKERIDAYDAETFLLGYDSREMMSTDFVICLTVEARDLVCRRNGDISRAFLNYARNQVKKTPGAWTSSLEDNEDLETSIVRSRDPLEVEILLRFDTLGRDRFLTDRGPADSRDGYVQLVPSDDEEFKKVEKLRVTRSVQTHLEPRSTGVQTYPGYPKNAWTQYVYEDTFSIAGEDEKEQSVPTGRSSTERQPPLIENDDTVEHTFREKEPIELFLEDRSPEMIETIRYNAAVNLHVDDIASLAKQGPKGSETRRNESIYEERVSFVSLEHTAGHVVSDVAWHPKSIDLLAVSYLRWSSNRKVENQRMPSNPGILLWSLKDSLRPRLHLDHGKAIHCLSFCPSTSDILVAVSGSASLKNVPSIGAVMLSRLQEDSTHKRPIRWIVWVPDDRRIDPDGRSKKEDFSGSSQLMTAFQDGTIAVWDLFWNTNCNETKKRSSQDQATTRHRAIRPTCRLKVPNPEDSPMSTLICLCPTSNLSRSKRQVEQDDLDPPVETRRRGFWCGTSMGELSLCTWEGETYGVEAEDSEVSGVTTSCSYAHDGPVIEIVRSPHLADVVLTIGGNVFGVWSENHSEWPIFRRRCDVCLYVACCWSGRAAGVFLIGRQDGDVEVWNVKRRTSKAVFSWTVPGGMLVGLHLREGCFNGGLCDWIGAGDRNGALRVYSGESGSREEEVERLDWFEEYVWSETRRKSVFSRWQKDFLENDSGVIARRAAKEKEARRRKLDETREELQRQQEERIKSETEKAARNLPVSKDVLWKKKQARSMRNALLKKKGLVPSELEEQRMPLVRAKEERRVKFEKAAKRAAFGEKFYEEAVFLEFPEVANPFVREEEAIVPEEEESDNNEQLIAKYLEEYINVRDEARRMLAEISVNVGNSNEDEARQPKKSRSGSARNPLADSNLRDLNRTEGES